MLISIKFVVTLKGDNMKVAIVSPYITSYFLSDKLYNSQQLGLAASLTKNGVDVDIYTCQTNEHEGSKKIYLENNVYFTVHYISYFMPIKYQPIMPSLYKNLKRKEYDIIISSEDYQFTTLHLVLISFKLKSSIGIFQGAYDYLATDTYLNILWKLYDLVFGTIIRKKTDFVIAKTNEAKKYMENKKYTNVQAIPVGLNSNLFQPKRKLFKKKLNIDAPLILYVGNDNISKNLKTLIDSFSIVHNKYDSRLLLISYHEISSELSDYIKEKGIKDKVITLNKIENKKMPYIYSSADVFVLPSKKEIFGMVVLEAMACGTPVISTPVPAAKDIIKDGTNGIIVPVSDSEKLAESILSVITNEETRELLGENARKSIEQKYDWDYICKQYIKVFNDVLDNNSR